ncbi:murein hydrolase activator EnvC family protein [Hypericibacter sp.]|uniref:murein hydrolase activator EnvC family protein n=1 Tax=Hypericibacter sp. TaxID=2705401 RepID=UPI003D6D869D
MTRPGFPRWPLYLLLTVLTAAPACPGSAQETEAQDQDQLKQVEQALERDRARIDALQAQQTKITQEIAALQDRMVAAAKHAQDLETGLDEIAGTLATLEESLDTKEAELAGRRKQMDASLAALGWLALQPPAALLIGAERPLDRLRGALLLGSAVPALKTRMSDLRTSLAELGRLKQEIAQRRTALENESASLADENQDIAKMVTARQALASKTGAEQAAATKRVEKLAAEAKDLRDLLARLATLTAPAKPDIALDAGSASPDETQLAALPGPASRRPFPDPPSAIALPAAGTVLARFGDTLETGGKSQGVTFRTRSEAQVVAPFDGQVVFKGPFRGYGAILIIEHAGGYHSLLAGLGRIDVTLGQWVKEGEPVGQMGPVASGGPKLYVELRRGGQPIDPAPWLGIRDN